MDLADCFKKGMLKNIERDPNLVRRTLKMAADDLHAAHDSMVNDGYVWASIQLYSSMLNAARALMFDFGIREKSHVCCAAYLRERHRADYGDLVDKFDIVRRERHIFVYDSREEVSPERVQEHLGWADEFYCLTVEIIEKRNSSTPPRP